MYFKLFPYSFCMFFVKICNVFHFQITIKLFLFWQWTFIVSLPTINVIIWLNTFMQHQTKFVNVSVTESVCVFIHLRGVLWPDYQVDMISEPNINLKLKVTVFCMLSFYIFVSRFDWYRECHVLFRALS